MTSLCKWSTYGFCSCKTEQLLLGFLIISCLVVLWWGRDDYSWKVPCDWQTSVPPELIRAQALERWEITQLGTKKEIHFSTSDSVDSFVQICVWSGKPCYQESALLPSWCKQTLCFGAFDFLKPQFKVTATVWYRTCRVWKANRIFHKEVRKRVRWKEQYAIWSNSRLADTIVNLQTQPDLFLCQMAREINKRRQ